MNFKKLNSQSGRSMVEMLGVLAIIGVLSVGGIAGYSLSMRRHRANGVVDLASKYALVTYSSCQQKMLNGEVSSLSECVQWGTVESKRVPLFDDAGVGDVPAGLSSTYNFQRIETDASGIDTVVLDVPFADQKLCQAVASITGTACPDSDPRVTIKIKQN